MSESMNGFAMPESPDTEHQVLGALIIDPALILPLARKLLAPDCFVGPRRAMYEAILWLEGNSLPIDAISVSNRLKMSLPNPNDSELQVAMCLDVATPFPQVFPRYAKRLVEESIRRKVIARGREMALRAAWAASGEDRSSIKLLTDSIDTLDAEVSEMCERASIGRRTTGEIVRILPVIPKMKEFRGSVIERGLAPSCSAMGQSWPQFSALYRPAKGMLNVFTGIPSHGKSEFVDAIMLNMAFQHNWKWAVFSPENYPYERYVQKLTEKYIGLPLTEMNEHQIQAAGEWLDAHFFLVEANEDATGVDDIKALTRHALKEHQIDGVVWDPWNEMELDVRPHERETDCIGRNLAKLRRFARKNNVFFGIVAHPAKMQRDLKTRKYLVPTLYDISGCYSDDTEVLTKRGWLRHSEISLIDEVACFDPVSSTMFYDNPSRVIKKEHTGDMLSFSGYGYDLLVTPEHKMVLKPFWKNPKNTQAVKGIGRPEKWKKNEWSFVRADEVPSSLFEIPIAAKPPSGKNEISEPMAALAGWYVAEGCSMPTGFSITQAEGVNADAIELLLNDLGIKHSVGHRPPGGKGGKKFIRYFYVGNKTEKCFVNWMKKEFGEGSKNVRISDSVFNSSVEVKTAFLAAYLLGDGCCNNRGNYSATTISQRLKDDLQRLSIELGYTCSFSERRAAKKNHSQSWIVNISKRTSTALRSRNKKVTTYSGSVWCLTVSTGAYFVRRNGKACVCGNSSHWYNKSDNGITVYRNFDNDTVDIHVQKVKYKSHGAVGVATMKYEKGSGRFKETVDTLPFGGGSAQTKLEW